jgi:hypothetical protein
MQLRLSFRRAGIAHTLLLVAGVGSEVDLVARQLALQELVVRFECRVPPINAPLFVLVDVAINSSLTSENSAPPKSTRLSGFRSTNSSLPVSASIRTSFTRFSLAPLLVCR